MSDVTAPAPWTTRYYYSHREYDTLLAREPMAINLRSRVRTAVPFEDTQARNWLTDVLGNTRPTRLRAGDYVAMALARLCGNDSQVMITWRKLIEQVGGPSWLTQNGVRDLVEAGWLLKETTGSGRGASTTFYLMPGDLVEDDLLDDQDVAA